MAALLLTLLPIEIAHAQCGFDHPQDAKKMKVTLVQEHVPCGVGCPEWEPCDTPNTSTENGIPGCTPPRTWSDVAGNPDGWRFGPKGRGSLQLRALRKPPVRDGVQAAEGLDFSITLSLTGVEDDSGPASGTGGLRMIVRLTFDHAQNGDMTVIDLPLYFPFALANGRARIKTTADAAWGPGGWSQQPLPVCTSVAIPSVQILDGDNYSFAVPGLYLH